MLNYQLDPSYYNLSQVFNWGICSAHFKEAYKKNALDYRVAHAVLATLELIPIVPSFIELILVSAYGQASTPLRSTKLIKPLTSIGNLLYRNVFYPVFLWKQRELSYLIKKEKELPLTKNPLTLSFDDYLIHKVDWEHVILFFKNTAPLTTFLHQWSLELKVENQQLVDFEKIIDNHKQADSLWKYAETYFQLLETAGSLRTEINVLAKEDHRKITEWKGRAESLNRQVNEFRNIVLTKEPSFCQTKVVPLSNLAMNLKRITNCIDDELFFNGQTLEDRDLFNFDQPLAVPSNGEISQLLVDKAEDVKSIWEKIKKNIEKYSKHLQRLETTRSGASSIGEEFADFQKTALFRINERIKNYSSYIEDAHKTIVKISKQLAPLEEIRLLFHAKKKMNELDAKSKGINELITNVIRGYKTNSREEMEQILRMTKTFYAEQLYPLEQLSKQENPTHVIHSLLKNYNEKVGLIQNKASLLNLWNSVNERKENLFRLNVDALVEEQNEFIAETRRIEKVFQNHKEIGFFERIRSMFSTTSDEKILELCAKVINVLKEIE
ncbi:MAG: hypothetical protein WCG42_02320, partial [Parachlamydiaceae bacterium]